MCETSAPEHTSVRLLFLKIYVNQRCEINRGETTVFIKLELAVEFIFHQRNILAVVKTEIAYKVACPEVLKEEIRNLHVYLVPYLRVCWQVLVNGTYSPFVGTQKSGTGLNLHLFTYRRFVAENLACRTLRNGKLFVLRQSGGIAFYNLYSEYLEKVFTHHIGGFYESAGYSVFHSGDIYLAKERTYHSSRYDMA